MAAAPISLPQIPMVAPDGTPGMVDAPALPGLVAQGYKPGVHITSPDGTKGVAAYSDVKSLRSQGYKTDVDIQNAQATSVPDPNAAGIVSTPLRFLKSAASSAINAGSGAYQALTAPPQGKGEAVADAFDALPLYRALVSPSVSAYKQGAQMLDDPTSSPITKLSGVGHVVASAIPGVGPAITSTADSMLPQIDQGNYAGAAGTAATNALIAYLTGKAGGKVVSMMDSRLPVAGQNYTPANAAGFEAAIAKPGVTGNRNFIPQDVTPQALSPLRQQAANMAAGSPSDQAFIQTLTGKANPLDTIRGMLDLHQKALSGLESQHAGALNLNGQLPVDTTPIQQALAKQIVPGMADSDVAGINDLIQRAGQIKTLSDLNSFRQMMNTEASPSYRQTPTAAGRAMAPQDVARSAADNVRDLYFDQLQEASGIDYRPLKLQESNLLTSKEAFENMLSPVARAEATFKATSPLNQPLKSTVGDLANIIKDPKTALTQTILRQSPATQPAYFVRQALKNLPDAQPINNPAPPVPVGQGSGLFLDASTPSTVQGSPVASPPSPVPQAQFSPLIQRLLSGGGDAPSLSSEASGPPSPAQAPSTPYPPLNEATAKTRVTPTQYRSPNPVPTTGSPRPVNPGGVIQSALFNQLTSGDLNGPVTDPTTNDLLRAIARMRQNKGKGN